MQLARSYARSSRVCRPIFAATRQLSTFARHKAGGACGIVSCQARLEHSSTNTSEPDIVIEKPTSWQTILPPLREPYTQVPVKKAPHMENYKEFIGMQGGEIVTEVLNKHGVKHMFGYTGAAILNILDSLYVKKHAPVMVLPRHEQNAVHMATGYSRATGKPGVVLVTSGPGATNTITGIHDALSDGVPLVVMTGQVPTGIMGTDAFQEANIVAMTKPCTKWSYTVHRVDELPAALNEAFRVATSGRPGPVLIDLPKDTLMNTLKNPSKGNFTHAYTSITQNASRSPAVADSESLSRAIDMINKAKRPVIIAGHGVKTGNGSNALRQLAAKANIPVASTLHGLGCMDARSPLALGMAGMHGTAAANWAIQNADLVISIGSRFDDRLCGNYSKFAPAAKQAALEGCGGFLHFDIQKRQISKVIKNSVGVVGDAHANMSAILPHVKAAVRPDWSIQVHSWKTQFPLKFAPSSDPLRCKPQQVIRELSRQTAHMRENTMIVTGVGQHQMFTAQHYEFTHPNLITSGGQGVMGFGLPAAMGVKVANPDKLVVDIDGDASFSMTGFELATAAAHNIGVKVVVLDNGFQGMVRQWQNMFHGDRFSQTPMRNPDFHKVADAMGLLGLKVEKQSELSSKMKQWLEHPGAALLEVPICEDENVYPIVKPGNSLSEMTFDPLFFKNKY